MSLPSGFDRADGLDGRIGTATPEGAVKVSHAGGEDIADMPVEELPESPEVERAEQATLTHHYRTDWADGVTRIYALGRGLVRTDSDGNWTKLLSAKLQHEKGGTALLTTVEEGLSFDSPPDEFSVAPVELGVNILKHPRYFYAFFGDGYGSLTEARNQMVVRLLQDYFENVSAQYRDAIINLLSDSLTVNGGTEAGTGAAQPPAATPNAPSSIFVDGATVSGTDLAKAAAMEIVTKYWRGEETPYIVGWQITWSAFYFRPQLLDPGGRIEDPMTQARPQLPEYFFSPAYPPNSFETVFDAMAVANPQCYSSDGTAGGSVNISWLRKADDYDYQRTWFKVIRTWIGSPVGFWDTDLYNRLNRPRVYTDYHMAYVTP